MSLFDQHFAAASDQLMHLMSDEVTYTPPGVSGTPLGITALVGEEMVTDRLSKDGLRLVTEREFLIDVNPDSPHFSGLLDPNQAHIQTSEQCLLPHGSLQFENVVYRIRNIRAGQVGGLLAVMCERTDMALKSSETFKPRRGFNGQR